MLLNSVARAISFPIVVTLLLYVGSGCSTVKQTEMQQSIQETPWSILYNDGSGNTFRFWQDSSDGDASFEFTPVSPATSSSGTYSGGEPNSGSVSAKQVAVLWRSVLELEEGSVEYSLSDRVMGSGAFDRTTPLGSRKFIVKRGPGLMDFDKYVQQFKGE